jgi:hypothetical protein
MSLQYSSTPKIKKILADLPEGIYLIETLAERLHETGAIGWGTNWRRVKKYLALDPQWHWNGDKRRHKCAWVKTSLPPTLPEYIPSTPQPMEEDHTPGPVTTCLNKVEVMMERLCSEWKIPTDDIQPPRKTNDKALQACLEIRPVLAAAMKRPNHYISAREFKVMIAFLDGALK